MLTTVFTGKRSGTKTIATCYNFRSATLSDENYGHYERMKKEKTKKHCLKVVQSYDAFHSLKCVKR